jgi:hypothetical protein
MTVRVHVGDEVVEQPRARKIHCSVSLSLMRTQMPMLQDGRMADRYRTEDGWSVEVVWLTCTPDHHDGEWLRVRYCGYIVQDAWQRDGVGALRLSGQAGGSLSVDDCWAQRTERFLLRLAHF